MSYLLCPPLCPQLSLSPTLCVTNISVKHNNIFQGYTAKDQLGLENGENSQNKLRVPNFGEAFGLPEEDKITTVISNRNAERSIPKKTTVTKKQPTGLSQKHRGTGIYQPNQLICGLIGADRRTSVRSSP